MNIIERVKKILVSPKTEWINIEAESESSSKILTGYLIWLALIPCVACIIGYGIIGYNVLGVHVGSLGWGIKMGIEQFVTIIVGTYVAAWVISALAGNYGCEKNFDKAFALMAYGYTATCVGGVFYIIPGLRILASLCSIYTLYLMYVGFQPITKVADDKKGAYMVISIVVAALVWFVVGLILTSILGVGAAASML